MNLANKIYALIQNLVYDGCYQLICTIVGLAEEPPFDKHDKCLCSSVSDDPPFVPSQFLFSVIMTMAPRGL